MVPNACWNPFLLIFGWRFLWQPYVYPPTVVINYIKEAKWIHLWIRARKQRLVLLHLTVVKVYRYSRVYMIRYFLSYVIKYLKINRNWWFLWCFVPFILSNYVYLCKYFLTSQYPDYTNNSMTLPISTMMVGRKMMFDIYIRYCKKKTTDISPVCIVTPLLFWEMTL